MTTEARPAHRLVACQRVGSAMPEYSIVEALFEDSRLNGWSTEVVVPREMAELMQETLAAMPRRPQRKLRFGQVAPSDPFYEGSKDDLSALCVDYGRTDCTLPAIAEEIDEWQRREID